MATMTSVPQASSEELYGVNLSETEIQEEIQKWIEQSKPLRIAVVGVTGTGKSSLINSLIGREVAEEGAGYDDGTTAVNTYTLTINGYEVTIWDTPGLQNVLGEDNKVIAKKIGDTCKEVDLLIYCAQMTHKHRSLNNKEAISVITQVLGKKVWDNAVFVLTYANYVHPPDRSSSTEEITFFNKRLRQWRDKLRKILKDEQQIKQASIDQLPIVPTGHREPALPDRPDWKATFWMACCYQTKRYKTSILEKRLAACERVMKEEGSLDQIVMQGVFLGQPRSGKSSLMKRLVGRPLSPLADSPSTGAAESIVQVAIRSVPATAVQVSGLEWNELSNLSDEAITLLQEMPVAEPLQKMPVAEPLQDMPVAEPQQKSLLHRLFEGISSFVYPLPSHQPKQSAMPSAQPSTEYKPPKQFFKEAMANRTSTLGQYLSDPWTLYLTDSGGQPEFQELLPALVSGPSVFFLVFRLDVDLSKRFLVEYVRSTGESTVPYESSFTVEENLLQSLSSIASSGAYIRLTRSGPGQDDHKRVVAKPKVLFVGTHKDKVPEEEIKRIDKRLQQLVRGTVHFKEGIIHFASESEMIFTINNLSKDEEDVQQIRAAIERLGKQSDDFQVSTPYSWLIFSIIIRQKNVPLLSRKHCFKIAQSCSIHTQGDLDDALWFHHTQTGILRYFNDVPELRDVVILDPRYLFDRFNNLIVETFTFKNVNSPAVREEFIKKGIFPADLFEQITARDADELLPPTKFLKLLQYLHIVTSLHDKHHGTQFFMPCVLAHTEVAQASVGSRLPGVSPLLISFQSGCCPKGLFGSLVVCLLAKKAETRLEWKLVAKEIFRDQISLRVTRCDTAVLKLHPTHLSLEVTCSSQASAHNIPLICNDIRNCIEKSIVQVAQTLHYRHNAEYSLAFACPDTDQEEHPATVSGMDYNGQYLECTQDLTKTGTLSLECLVWFPEEEARTPVDPTAVSRDTPASGSCAATPRLREADLAVLLDLLKDAAARWREIGLNLGFSDGELESIDHTPVLIVQGPSGYLRKLLSQWLKKAPPTHSWPTVEDLASAMRRAGEEALAFNLRGKFETARRGRLQF